jgi:hypothetical protein
MPITLHTDRQQIDEAAAVMALRRGGVCLVTWTRDEEQIVALSLAFSRGATVERRGRVAVAYRKMGGRLP